MSQSDSCSSSSSSSPATTPPARKPTHNPITQTPVYVSVRSSSPLFGIPPLPVAKRSAPTPAQLAERNRAVEAYQSMVDKRTPTPPPPMASVFLCAVPQADGTQFGSRKDAYADLPAGERALYESIYRPPTCGVCAYEVPFDGSDRVFRMLNGAHCCDQCIATCVDCDRDTVLIQTIRRPGKLTSAAICARHPVLHSEKLYGTVRRLRCPVPGCNEFTEATLDQATEFVEFGARLRCPAHSHQCAEPGCDTAVGANSTACARHSHVYAPREKSAVRCAMAGCPTPAVCVRGYAANASFCENHSPTAMRHCSMPGCSTEFLAMSEIYPLNRCVAHKDIGRLSKTVARDNMHVIASPDPEPPKRSHESKSKSKRPRDQSGRSHRKKVVPPAKEDITTEDACAISRAIYEFEDDDDEEEEDAPAPAPMAPVPPVTDSAAHSRFLLNALGGTSLDVATRKHSSSQPK